MRAVVHAKDSLPGHECLLRHGPSHGLQLIRHAPDMLVRVMLQPRGVSTRHCHQGAGRVIGHQVC
eukprot:578210-Lingulodinium_polyedra.AAC.2